MSMKKWNISATKIRKIEIALAAKVLSTSESGIKQRMRRRGETEVYEFLQKYMK